MPSDLGVSVQRSLLRELIRWKSRPNRKPLIVQGARQTGKTWLMNEFARQEFPDFVRIDFLYDEAARSLFSQSLDPHQIVSRIELRTGHHIDPERTLITFDEIQEALRGLTSLKYFCEQAREYHIVAAGSYMGLSLHHGDSFPVGKVDRLTLRPMSFVEFVRAVSGDLLADALLRADVDLLTASDDLLGQRLKEYFVIGGMPEVVDSFRRDGDVTECRRLQLQVLSDYDGDFGKHVPTRILERLRLVWRSLPGQLARENKKFVYSVVRAGARARDFEESLQWLRDYGVVYRVPRVSTLRFPLSGYESVSGFKLFCVDVGLLGALAGLDPSVALGGSSLFTEFTGAMTEQCVAQELSGLGLLPVYWSSSTGSAEVDFAIDHRAGALPIEVKAHENLRAKSLRAACEKFGLSRAVRTSLSPYRDEGWLVNIPLWALGQVERLA